MSARARLAGGSVVVALVALVAACSVDRPAPSTEPIARAEQRTVDDGAADQVFGQPDPNQGDPPAAVSITSLRSPSGLAVANCLTPACDLLYVADTDENRLRPMKLSDLSPLKVMGQPSEDVSDPNAGSVDPIQGGFDHPLAVAYDHLSTEWMAADTGNQRVLRGNYGAAPRLVYGQHGSFFTRDRNDGGISAFSLADPKGVAMSQSYAWIADAGNHRVLGYPTGSTVASLLIGQIDFTRGDPNAGLGGPSDHGLNDPHGLALTPTSTAAGPYGLWIADTGNHRVLFVPSTGSEIATRVLGQPWFGSAEPGVGPSSLNGPTAVAIDPEGGVWVADTGNHRAVHFPRNSTIADRVLGQPSLHRGDAPSAPYRNTMLAPTGIAVAADGDVLIADTGYHRLLRFDFDCSVLGCDDGDPCTEDTCQSNGACAHFTTTFSKACAPYGCDTITRTCDVSCNRLGCGPGAYCINGSCVYTCATDGQCAGVAGHPYCRSGVCCDRDCSGVCERCDDPYSFGGGMGTCVAIQGAPPFGKSCEGADPDCAGSCDGVQRDRCVYAPSGSTCGAEGCEDGIARSLGKCDGIGRCVTEWRSCGAYACTPAGCTSDCLDDADCAPSARCVAGACVTTLAARGGGCAIEGLDDGDAGDGGGGARPWVFGLAAIAIAATARAARRRRS